MASATAMSAARSMPAVYTIPLGPRVRPPRLLPGTKAENTNPQPAGAAPSNKIWVQGKWREHQSNASKDRKIIQSTQVEKALRHSTHGMNIYAYRQIRTNQVVYSLSRVMQNNKILSQLIYHGKQTKPAALRRDVWRPYFSIHFPQTAAGSEAGLDTFQMLRELSARRQLSPPEGSLLATKEDVIKAQAKYDPATLARLKEEKSSDLSKLPRLGQLLPPKYRAKKLMDQKVSSVADVAFALSLIGDSTLSPHDKKLKADARLKSRHTDRSRRNRRRINEIRRQEEAKEVQIAERQKLVDSGPGQLSLDKHAAARIALEHNGVLTTRDRVTGLDDILQSAKIQSVTASSSSLQGSNEVKNPSDSENENSRRVLVLWSDLKDAMNAEQWTSNVQHDWFDAKAVVKQEKTVVRQPAFVDEEGHAIEEQKQKRLFQVSSSSHVMGRDVSDNWLYDASQPRKENDMEDPESNLARREFVVRRMIAAKTELRRLQKLHPSREKAINATKPSLDAIEGFGTTKTADTALSKSEKKVEYLQSRYPEYDVALDELNYFSEVIARHRRLAKKVNALEPGADGRRELMDEEHALAKEIRDQCDTQFPGFSISERQLQEAMLKSRSEALTKELEEKSENMKVNTVLKHHRKLLEQQGDENYIHAATSDKQATGNTDRKIEKHDLKNMNVEVDMQELDKRSMWSRVKGVFGR